MKITETTIDIISASVGDFPPEMGGIIGSTNGDIIDKVIIDSKSDSQGGCSYSPNVDFLNEQIKQWQQCRISFMGIFHTHFHSVKTLSDGDKQYITAIMEAMPVCMDRLYFPIFVLPERRLFAYRAIRSEDVIKIIPDDVCLEKGNLSL